MLLSACTGAPPDASGARGTGVPTSPVTADAATAEPPSADPRPDVAPGPDAPSPSGPAACADGCAQPFAEVDVDVVDEASGVEHGLRDPDLIWVLDDGPDLEGLYATAPDGPVGVVGVEGLAGGDTEALAAGACAADDPAPCLFIGDIGDNRSGREQIRILRVPEPDLTDGVPTQALTPDVATLRYPDGPHDAEAMFTVDGRLFIVTKATFDDRRQTTSATLLFEAPRFGDGVLEARGEVPVPAPGTPLLSLIVGNVVVGADLGGAGVILRTYDHAVLYTPPGPDADPGGFPTWPFREIPTGGPLQTEAVAFVGDDCTHDTAGEGDPVVWRNPCPAGDRG